MRRTKAWWARLTKAERSELYWLERGDSGYSRGSAYLPEGYSDCAICSTPCRFGGLCQECGKRLDELLAKADGEEAR
jgi:hypothetical protein